MLCREIVEIIEHTYPKHAAETWDNVGLLVGRTEKEVKKIFIALDATDEVIETAIQKAQATADLLARAQTYCNKVLFIMDNIRHIADEAETVVSRDYWPYPTYGDILFKI